MDQLLSISLLVLAIALLLPVLSRVIPFRAQRVLRYGLFFAYVLANLYETILFRSVRETPSYELEALWSYRRSISLEYGVLGTIERLLTDGLNAALDGIHITDRGLLLEILLNILLYVPLGYLLPYVWPVLINRPSRAAGAPAPPLFRRLLAALFSPWRIWLIGFAASVATELAQLVFRIGLFEFDDIINNTLGCILGSLIFRLMIDRRAQKYGKEGEA